MGNISPAHDLLTGYLRSYWGVVLVFGVGAALQVRLIVRTVVRFFRNRPEEKQLGERLEDEFIALTYLSGPGPDRRRQEVKKQLDQYSAVATGRFMELFILNNRVADVLADKGIRVYRTFVGEYMTSIEMQGFSLSLLRLDEEMKELLDAPADTPAWK